jgi:choice-of-anchor B domain-containing protein
MRFHLTCHILSGSALLAVLSLTSPPLAAQTHRPAEDSGELSFGGSARTGFGAAVVVSGDEIFVGRPDEFPVFPAPAARVGGVHVFRSGADGWVERALITAPDVEVGDGFGLAIAVDGDVMLVGAPQRNEGRGAVYVFERAGEDWALGATLTLSRPAPGDAFGESIELQGALALIGAPGRDGHGAAYEFERKAAQDWGLAAELRPGSGDAGGRFGASISFEGDRALVGAPGPFGLAMVGAPPAYQPGAAYVFARSGAGSWEERARLAPESGVLAFGYAVLLEGDGAMVTSPLVDRATGSLFAYEPDAAGGWQRVGRAGPPGEAPQTLFGYSLSMAGSDLVVGAPGAEGLNGAAYIMRRGEDGGWDPSQTLSTQTRGMFGFYGASTTATEDVIVVGAPGAEFFAGIGYVYARDASTGEWTERGSIVDAAGGLAPIVGGELECESGEVQGFTCADVDLVSFLPVESLGGERGVQVNDLWGWTDSQTGREYAIVGRFDATAFVDVSDPENPVYLGELPLHEGAQPSLWRDFKTYGDHVFVVSDGSGPHGVQVFDLTLLRDVTGAPVIFEETAHYDGIFSAHNIVINEETGFAYTVGNSMGGETCGGALHMIDVRDPTNPTFAGCFGDPATGNASTGYTHDAQCVVYQGPDEEHRGKEICFNASETALGIADVTDKDNPVAVASASYPNVGYAHQGWISSDQRYFFLDDELDEIAGSTDRTRTLVWDIEDLDDPVLVKEFMGTTAASDHNLYVRGRYMYQSNYVGGLRIIDVADPENPVEVAYFDTVPWGEDTPGFSGSWSNYPFFDSGVILVTSMREGLFILRKKEPELVP